MRVGQDKDTLTDTGAAIMSKSITGALSEYLTDKKPGFQFTVYDYLDWIKVRWPRSAPTLTSFGRLILKYPQVQAVGRTVANQTVYEVVA